MLCTSTLTESHPSSAVLLSKRVEPCVALQDQIVWTQTALPFVSGCFLPFPRFQLSWLTRCPLELDEQKQYLPAFDLIVWLVPHWRQVFVCVLPPFLSFRRLYFVVGCRILVISRGAQLSSPV